MRKTWIGLMMLVFTMVLGACGSRVTPALDCRVEEDRPLRVGMNLIYEPFEMRNLETNEPEGISVDIAHAFGEFIGCDVEIVNVNFANLIDALTLGDIDVIIASMSATPQRAQLIDFSDPYMYYRIIGLVNQDYADANGITEDSSAEDVLAIETTSFVGIAGQVSYSLPLELGIPQSRVRQMTGLESAVARVVQGDDDILMMSGSPVARNHNVNPDTTLILWDPFDISPIAMGIRQGEDEFRDLANAFIASLDEPGGVNDQLRERWDDDIRAILGRYGIDFFLYEE